MSLSHNQIYFQSLRVSEIFSGSETLIDYPRYGIQRRNFDFWISSMAINLRRQKFPNLTDGVSV
jgi:hypothetical protein